MAMRRRRRMKRRRRGGGDRKVGKGKGYEKGERNNFNHLKKDPKQNKKAAIKSLSARASFI